MRRGTVPVPLRTAVHGGLSGSAAVAERVGFWTAVAFPAVYVGVYALETVATVPDLLLVSAFLLNGLALIVGHTYGRDAVYGHDRDHDRDQTRTGSIHDRTGSTGGGRR